MLTGVRVPTIVSTTTTSITTRHLLPLQVVTTIPTGTRFRITLDRYTSINGVYLLALKLNSPLDVNLLSNVSVWRSQSRMAEGKLVTLGKSFEAIVQHIFLALVLDRFSMFLALASSCFLM